MKLSGKNIGLCITGSFCTLNDNISVFEDLKANGANLTAVFSNTTKTSVNKFSNGEERYKIFKDITEKPVIDTIEKAEPIGPNKLFDIILLAPCTGFLIKMITFNAKKVGKISPLLF